MPWLTAMLAFFVPPDYLPSLTNISCSLEENKSLEPYDVQRKEFFYSWDMIHPPVRDQILDITSYGFCRHQYDVLLEETKGQSPPFSCDQLLNRPAGLQITEDSPCMHISQCSLSVQD